MSRTRDNRYNIQNYKSEVDRERTRLLALQDTDLLNQILSHPNPNRLNTVVPYDSFPAYDIALKIKENGWTPTTKQRKALVNVYSHDIVYVQRPLELDSKRPKPIKGLSNPVALSPITKKEFAAYSDSDDSRGGFAFNEIADSDKIWGFFGQANTVGIDRV